MATRVFISDALIIRACNTRTGSGGVWRWSAITAKKVITKAESMAPLGDPLNHAADGWPLTRRPEYIPGCYKGGFRFDGIGSEGHYTRATVYNICPHAKYVERGRGSSSGYEVFTSAHVNFGADIITRHTGTGGWDGKHILYKAFKDGTSDADKARLKSVTSRLAR